ncbi:MAG TPA: hypothetical protein PLQ49_01635 [Methanothrix sp.]|nr:hypothetical protein [Methanothrix sp.]HRW82642.1 hypothetical protein [Methanothrix sp.]
MRSNWLTAAFLALFLLSAAGSCREGQEGSTISALDTGAGSTSSVGSAPPSSQLTPAIVAGTWSLVLTDAATGRSESVELEIRQIGEVIFGSGSTGGSAATATSFLSVETEPRPTRDEGIRSMVWWLNQDPAPVDQAAQARYLTIGASGLVNGQSVSLDLIFLDENVLHRLDLDVFGSSVSGSYLAYDSWGEVRSGSCYGSVMSGSVQAAVPLGQTHEPVTIGGSGY